MLWQKIANNSPPPLLAASGLLHDRAHGYDCLPQPGFVGHRYRQGGLVIFGLNPAAGGDGLSRDDITQYELLNNLRKASGNEVVEAFKALMNHFTQFMPNWKIIENNGLNSIFREHQISFSDVAYLNLCKWRTTLPKLSVPVKKES